MKIVDTQTLYRGRKFDLAVRSLVNDAGQSVDVAYLVHPGSVVVLPILNDGRLVLIRNYRCTLDRTLLELPAGTLAAGERPAAAADRELLEETGFRAGRLSELLAFYPAPGISDERMWLYLAEDLRPGATRLEADEEIRVEPTTLAEALSMSRDGRIADGKTMIGLWYWQLRLIGPAQGCGTTD